MRKSQKLFRRHLSGALNPLLSRYQIKREIIYLFAFVTGIVVILFMLTVIPFVLNTYCALFFISSFYYWFTLMTKTHLNSNKLYLILSANFFSQLLDNYLIDKCFPKNFSTNYSSVETNVELTSFIICVSTVGSALFLFGFSLKLGSVIIILTQLCRVLSNTCFNSTNTSSLRPFVTFIFSLIGIIVARSTESALSPVISSLITADSRVVAWRRRRSSNATLAVPRRTSLPTLSTGNRALGCHGNHVSSDEFTLLHIIYLLFLS